MISKRITDQGFGMDWFDSAFRVFYAVPLRARACLGIVIMTALFWLPAALGMVRAFSEHPACATVQTCYRDWWQCMGYLVRYAKSGEQPK